MSEFGVKVSKPGIDLSTAIPKDLMFYSGYISLKVYSAASVTIATDASGNASQTVAHGLSYTPACIAFYSDNSGSTWIQAENYVCVVSTDPTNIVIDFVTATANLNYIVKYYVMVEEA